MNPNGATRMGEYNQDQWISLQAVRGTCDALAASEVERLKEGCLDYLRFRAGLDRFQDELIAAACRTICFDTGMSACCGFESIFTFFADHVVNTLFSERRETDALFSVLRRANRTGRCVYLGNGGCMWRIRPISCAMFFCDKIKEGILRADPETAERWSALQAMEKEFTWPVKPVLFDDLEKYFLGLGAKSPHMYFHQSPGLLRLKKKSGTGDFRA
ncbi:hypothetical protein Sfum_3297 [Syntrophobacter fumaroxidans MPOB]|uniref:Uncharacterized protein n=2 Tax=Syntrophobacter TaxID=29526 RepID=A0LNG8_SYNFM|nr:hypothetical protein Sfum_3297 [Syntrophobacter fumaroxidans MPOB]